MNNQKPMSLEFPTLPGKLQITIFLDFTLLEQAVGWRMRCSTFTANKLSHQQHGQSFTPWQGNLWPSRPVMLGRKPMFGFSRQPEKQFRLTTGQSVKCGNPKESQGFPTTATREFLSFTGKV